MQVKVFEARDMRSALEKVKQALGPDALILSSRSIEKGAKGSKNSGGIEVTAAVDSGGGMEEAVAQQPGRRQSDFQVHLESSGKNAFAHNQAAGADPELQNEIQEMKRSVRYLTKELSRISSGASRQGQDRCRDLDLSALGICPEAAGMFAEAAEGSGSAFTTGDPDELYEAMTGFISGHVSMANFTAGDWQGQKRMVFIGPTGVGKTTTIAKVAADFMFTTGKSVALATIDNYRIAAAEQLKIYGEIMNIPVEIARSPGQLADIFRRHQDRDLILVDTAGRSPRDELRRQELAGFLDPELNTENHLVMSAATSRQGLSTVMDSFAQLDIHGVVLTKLDECDVLGEVLNVGVKADCPLSFMTNGQNVPEDLIVPDASGIARMILKPDEVVAEWNNTEKQTRREACAN
ncbi:MAG: flagellar biosynthesis protein FlhF [Thermodesulfobacteriota bacterium]